jgi:hypothetical protein
MTNGRASLYDPVVDAWLDRLTDTNPELLEHIEDQIDILREEPISARARRRELRTLDGGFHWVLPFEAEGEAWLVVWRLTSGGVPVVVAVERTLSL